MNEQSGAPSGVLEGEMRALVDRQAIVDVLNRYARCVDTKAWADLDQVFVPGADCDFSPLGGPRAPFPEITEWIDTSLAPFSTQHMLSNYEVEIEGDTARSRTYLQAQHKHIGLEPERHLTFGGVYEDELVRTADGWRITHRTLFPMWTINDV
jgi:SnoaL-like protein